MEQNTLFPIPSTSRDETKKRHLQDRIIKKRNRLQKFLTKIEMLRIELEMVKQEYDVRIGSLYLKDNQLDLEIIHYKNIQELMQDGLTYDEALKKLHETYYAKQRELDQEKEKIRLEEETVQKREQADQISLPEIRKLWKKLIGKFHPDLVQNKDEKKKREVIMKQINKAYEERDVETLQRIENDTVSEVIEETTLQQLENILVTIENDMIKYAAVYRELRTSEWFAMKLQLEKSRRRNIDFFAEIERKLLDDIVKKYAILNELKKETA